MPKTLQRTNEKLLQRRENQFNTGDHNKDLYYQSRLLDKKNTESNDYWYEKNKEECVFNP